MTNTSGCPMPLDPPLEDDDSQPWWQTSPPTRITVHPLAPASPHPDSRALADGIDDWIESDGYPNDWIVPAPSAVRSTAPSPSSPQPNPADPGLSGRPAPRPDPLAAYWSLIPASRVGAMAWHPPIFPDSLGQFPLTPSTPPNVPPIPAGGLFDSLANLRSAPDTPPIPAAGGLLGALANLQPAPSVPAFNARRGPFLPMPDTQSVPTFRSAPFSGPPFQAPSGIDVQAPQYSLLGSSANPGRPTKPIQLADTDASSNFDSGGTFGGSFDALPVAAATPASFADGRSFPTGSALIGSDSNPLSSFLNALNPISSANAAEDEGGGLPPALFRALAQGLIDAATAKRLIEQGKFLQETQDARKDFLEVVQGRASSRALGVMLEASGVPRPQGYAAHHIAAGTEPRAEPARGALKKFGIGINDAVNGVFLPANRATQVIAGETIHSTLHTKEYYDAVNNALAEATTRQQAIDILQGIGRALQAGDYP